MKDKKRAQTTIEFLLLWSTIIAVIILVASPYIKPALNSVVTDKLPEVLNKEIKEDLLLWDD